MLKRVVKTHRFSQFVGWALLVSAAWQVAPAQIASFTPAGKSLADQMLRKPVPKPAVDPLAASETTTAYHPSATTAHRVVRVRLFSGRTIGSLTIQGEAPLRSGERKFARKISLSARDGKLILSYADHPKEKMARLRISAYQKGVMKIRIASGAARTTAGIIELRAVRNTIEVINVIDFERYAMGVVKPELGTLRLKADVLKAQLIAARSYLLTMRNRHKKQGFNFCDGEHCQVFAGVTLHEPAFEQAARSVRGEYLAYKGQAAAAFFHHSCGGMTAAVEDVWPVSKTPYLRRIRDGQPKAYCDRRGSRYAWTTRLEMDIVRRALIHAKLLEPRDTLDRVRVAVADESGRARQIHVAGTREKWIVASRFVNAVNRFLDREVLYSTAFKVGPSGSALLFEGRGWGHGVGLCQEGAIQMAREGKTYRQILAHYYPGTTISKLSE
jgi:stage II sporulation protein D